MPDVRHCALLFAGTLVVISACEKTENDWPVTPPREYTYADFSARLPEYLCDRLLRCPPARADALVSRALFQSVARCTDVLTRTAYRSFDPRAAIKAGRIVFHDDAAHAYLDALAGPCDGSAIEGDPSAGGALEGTVTGGGSCSANVECEAGNYCEHAGGACPGTCARLKPTGDACGTGDECASDYCEAGVCSKLTVAAPAASGAACGLQTGANATETPCAPNLFCLGKPTGVCRSAIPANAPCTTEDDVCVLEHLCMNDVDGAKRCRSVAVAHEGDLCTDETSPDIRLCDSFANLGCNQGTCVRVSSGAEGSACVGTSFGDSCDAGLHCPTASRVCERLGKSGDPCSASDQCASGWCISGTGTCSGEHCE